MRPYSDRRAAVFLRIVFISLCIASIGASVSISAPLDGAVVSPSVTLEWLLEADHSAQRCDVILDGELLVTLYEVEPFHTEAVLVRLPDGVHAWSVTCALDPVISSPTHGFTVIDPAASTLSEEHVRAGAITVEPAAIEGLSVNISATIHNQGPTRSVPYILEDRTRNITIVTDAVTVPANSSVQVNASDTAVAGPTVYGIDVDPDRTVQDQDRTDNSNSTTIHVPAWQTFHGSLRSSLVSLGSEASFFRWQADTGAIVLFSRNNGTFDVLDLHALGRATDGTQRSTDFSVADASLGMTGFADSLNATYRSGGEVQETMNLSVAGNTIRSVPVTDCEGSSHRTGVLWDAAGDADGQYDGDETLVFTVRTSEQNTTWGPRDYVACVPSALRDADGLVSVAVLI